MTDPLEQTLAAPPAAPIDITEHVGLVRWVLERRGYARRAFGALEYDDLMQEGMLGLARAAETFDPTRGAFATYAVHWIRQQIGRHLQDRSCTVRIPVHFQERRHKARERIFPVVRRLDAPLRGTQWDKHTTLADVLPNPEAPEPEEILDASGAPTRLAKLLDRANLSPRHRLALRMRARDMTLDQVGRELGVSRERARQLEHDALSRLRKAARVSPDAPRVRLSEGRRKAPNGLGIRRQRKQSRRPVPPNPVTQITPSQKDPCMPRPHQHESPSSHS